MSDQVIRWTGSSGEEYTYWVFPIYTDLGPKVLDGSFDPEELNSDRFDVGAVKIIADGSIQGYTGYLSAPYHVPYHGDTEYRGHPVVAREELFELVENYHGAGIQLAIHANGDAAIDNVIDAFRAAQQSHPNKDPRLILIHSQMAREDQLDRMAELGVTMVPTLVTYKALAELGAKLGLPQRNIAKNDGVFEAGQSSIAVAKAAGVELGFGTDLLGEAQPWQNREFAIRAALEPAVDVLRSMYVVNARLCGLEGEVGVIAPGMAADVVVAD